MHLNSKQEAAAKAFIDTFVYKDDSIPLLIQSLVGFNNVRDITEVEYHTTDFQIATEKLSKEFEAALDMDFDGDDDFAMDRLKEDRLSELS